MLYYVNTLTPAPYLFSSVLFSQYIKQNFLKENNFFEIFFSKLIKFK